jgi:dienelactone hydrolase
MRADRTRSRYVCLLHRLACVNALLLIVLFLNAFPARAAEDGPLIGIPGEYYYRTKYKALPRFKAMVIDPYGASFQGWSFGSQSQATNSTLAACNANVKKFEKGRRVVMSRGECHVLAAGNKLLIADAFVGPAWQEPLPGEDVPLAKGISRANPPLPRRGIMLHVHGCNGLGAEWAVDVWADFFNAHGFRFFAPNSFAEPRPTEICGQVPTGRFRDEAVIMKTRIAQTQRTLRELRKKFPGEKIYVWGHSEGAGVVKYLNAEVAGIVASGDECETDGQKNAAPSTVPILFMFGENDPYVDGFKPPFKDEDVRKCRNFARGKYGGTVIVKNARHDLFPWRRDVAKAFLKFIGVNDSDAPEPKTAAFDFNLTSDQAQAKSEYDKATGRKAFAANAVGAYSWVDRADFAEDAIGEALYDCAKTAGSNYFAQNSYPCALVDVDGKPAAMSAK